MKPLYIIMKGKKVYESKYFPNVEKARNFIKMRNPSRRFKEPEENKFVCTRFGTTFEIETIYP